MEKIIGRLYYNSVFAFWSVLWGGALQYSARCALYEASETFRTWRSRNAGVYIGLSDEGTALVRKWIEAFDHFYAVQPWFMMNPEERERVLSLLDELPPKSPNEMPLIERHRGALSF